MDQETLKKKSLELIHKTKGFLLLEKAHENSLTALLLISRAKLARDGKIGNLSKGILPLIKGARNLGEAESLIENKMAKLKIRMNELSSEILELSDLLEPYSSQENPTEQENR